MADRPYSKPFSVITNGSMAGNLTSAVTILEQKSMASYDVSWTGTTPVGAMTVQVSNTYALNSDGTVKTAGNWTTLTLSSPTPVSGNTGNGAIDIDATGFYAIRLVYTRTSGTGTMNAVMSAKVM